MNTAVLLLALVAVTVAQDYEVSEVQVKMMAKPKDSAASPTIEQMARVAAVRATSQNCCSYPTPEHIYVNAIPYFGEFKCSEPVTVSCSMGGGVLEAGIAIYGEQKLTANNVLTAGNPAEAQIQCNTTSKMWNFKPYPTEFAEVVCAYKTYQGEWIYGF